MLHAETVTSNLFYDVSQYGDGPYSQSFNPGRGRRVFSSSQHKNHLWDPTILLFHGYCWVPSLWVKELGLEADHLPTSSTEEWWSYASTPHTSSWQGPQSLKTGKTSQFFLPVSIVTWTEDCSLIPFRGKTFFLFSTGEDWLWEN
jgi:hypothetical protein